MKFTTTGIKEATCYTPCHYSAGQGITKDEVWIYARRYKDFGPETNAAFQVIDDSDSQTDYFVNEKIKVRTSHPLYAQVLAAAERAEASEKKARETRLLKKARLIESRETIVIDNRRWAVVSKEPKVRGERSGTTYALQTFHRPKHTYFAWISDDGKRYIRPSFARC